jgi:hypothetical protein
MNKIKQYFASIFSKICDLINSRGYWREEAYRRKQQAECLCDCLVKSMNTLIDIRSHTCGTCYHGCSILSNFPGKTVCLRHNGHRSLDWYCADWHDREPAPITESELADTQYSSFDGVVFVDRTSKYSGTQYPMGTFKYPVNNIDDAVKILDIHNFKVIDFIG